MFLHNSVTSLIDPAHVRRQFVSAQHKGRQPIKGYTYSLEPSCTFLQSCCQADFYALALYREWGKKIKVKRLIFSGGQLNEGTACRVNTLDLSGTDYLKCNLTSMVHRIINS